MGQVEIGGVDDGVLARRPQPGHGGAEVLERGQPGAKAAKDKHHPMHVVGFGHHAQPVVQMLQAKRVGRQRQPALDEAARWGGTLRQGAANGQYDVIDVRPAQAAQQIAPVNAERVQAFAQRLTSGAQIATQGFCEAGRRATRRGFGAVRLLRLFHGLRCFPAAGVLTVGRVDG